MARETELYKIILSKINAILDKAIATDPRKTDYREISLVVELLWLFKDWEVPGKARLDLISELRQLQEKAALAYKDIADVLDKVFQYILESFNNN